MFIPCMFAILDILAYMSFCPEAYYIFGFLLMTSMCYLAENCFDFFPGK